MKESFERNPEWITRHNAKIAKLPAYIRSKLYAIKSNQRAIDIMVWDPKYYEIEQLKACVKALDIAPDVDVHFSEFNPNR